MIEYLIRLNLNPKTLEISKYPEKHISAFKYK